MERLLVDGKKEDIQLIADLAVRLGMTTKFIIDEDLYTANNEPETRAEWDNLAANGQQLSDAGNEDENDSVIREFRERNE